MQQTAFGLAVALAIALTLSPILYFLALQARARRRQRMYQCNDLSKPVEIESRESSTDSRSLDMEDADRDVEMAVGEGIVRPKWERRLSTIWETNESVASIVDGVVGGRRGRCCSKCA